QPPGAGIEPAPGTLRPTGRGDAGIETTRLTTTCDAALISRRVLCGFARRSTVSRPGTILAGRSCARGRCHCESPPIHARPSFRTGRDDLSRSLQAARLVGVCARIRGARTLAAALGDERSAGASGICAHWKRVGRGVTSVHLARAVATARTEVRGAAGECKARRLSNIRLVLGERPLVDGCTRTRADERARVSFGDGDAIHIRRATLVVVRCPNGPVGPGARVRYV